MAFFDDFATAVSNYPSDKVTLSIVDRAPVPPATAGEVNVNEVWSFQIRVANTGNLNLTNVSFCVSGMNGARVGRSAAGPFVPDLLAPALPAVNAHSSVDSGNFFLLAPGLAKGPNTLLVRVHIEAFDVDLDHILKGHSGDAPQCAGNYADHVAP